MFDIIIDTLLDGIKLLPFLFITFSIIELLEHKFNNKTKKAIRNAGKFGPLIGSLCGALPQCGFSVAATNLYITRVISIGTLFSVYLSTSDEMLSVMLTQNVSISKILFILIIKIVIGMIFGFLIDFIIRRKNFNSDYDYNVCNKQHCDCKHSIFKSTLKHSLKTFFFILLITFIINILFSFLPEQLINKIFMKNNIFGPLLGSLLGLIPNCGASVMITELYLKEAINIGTCISGLLTGSGVALLILFKSNNNIKENVFIVITLYLIGVLSGIVIELLGIVF